MTRDEAISIMNVIIHMLEPQYDTDRVEDAVSMAIEALENIKALGEDMRICREAITDEKVLIGFNMAVALCNKHLGESENKE